MLLPAQHMLLPAPTHAVAEGRRTSPRPAPVVYKLMRKRMFECGD